MNKTNNKLGFYNSSLKRIAQHQLSMFDKRNEEPSEESEKEDYKEESPFDEEDLDYQFDPDNFDYVFNEDSRARIDKIKELSSADPDTMVFTEVDEDRLSGASEKFKHPSRQDLDLMRKDPRDRNARRRSEYRRRKLLSNIIELSGPDGKVKSASTRHFKKALFDRNPSNHNSFSEEDLSASKEALQMMSVEDVIRCSVFSHTMHDVIYNIMPKLESGGSPAIASSKILDLAMSAVFACAVDKVKGVLEQGGDSHAKQLLLEVLGGANLNDFEYGGSHQLDSRKTFSLDAKNTSIIRGLYYRLSKSEDSMTAASEMILESISLAADYIKKMAQID